VRENRLRGSPVMRLSKWSFGSRLARRIVAPAEKPDLPGDDFRAIALAAAVLCVVRARRQPSLNVDLAAFAEIPSACFRQLSERNNSVPLIWSDRSIEDFFC
jgi:hypothetical protein